MVSSVDDVIREKVINKRVRLDCDISGATEATIPLHGIKLEPIDTAKYLIHIPKESTNGRVITTVLALIFYSMQNVGLGGVFLGSNTGHMQTACMGNKTHPANAMSKSVAPQIVSQTSNVRIIDGHTVLVEDLVNPTQYGALRCVLANDAEFSTLSPPAWFAFGHLCTLATKAYIYNQYAIELDMAELVGGKELGKFKEIVDGYADANELYAEYYTTKWRKVQFMNDEPRHARFIKSMIGRYK